MVVFKTIEKTTCNKTIPLNKTYTISSFGRCKQKMLANLLGGFIVILVGVNLLPTVANQVAVAKGGNVTGASAAILDLVTVFYSLGIMSAGVSLAVGGLRQAGLV